MANDLGAEAFQRSSSPTAQYARMTFSYFNIVLDDGTETKPDGCPMSLHPWFLAAKRCLHVLYPQGFDNLRIADLGCLEGGYAVEFARMGFGEVLGIEIRPATFANCMFVKQRVDLPNLNFVKDDVWNLQQYGVFDVIFCGGILYHLEKPRRFLELMSEVARKAVLINTHFSTSETITEFGLSAIDENEGLPGRWFVEPPDLKENKLAAWDNRRSFWILREFLVQAIRDTGFPMVFEQYDLLGENLATSMASGYYKSHNRGMFVGVKV